MMQSIRVIRRIAGAAMAVAIPVVALLGVLAMAVPPGAAGGAGPADSAASARRIPPRLLGLSGRLRAIDLAPLAALVPALRSMGPGVHRTALTAPDGESIQALARVPLDEKIGANWQGYRVGYWPGERRTRRATARYPLPEGFLEVTPENENLLLSTHFRVRDFLTHDQQDTWPKVLVIQLRLLDKLELLDSALAARGRPAALRIMSGFRTPQYNALGVGPRGGRARDSRHMYGDAADVYVDADGDGRMDDLDGDHRITIQDARWLAALAAEVEAAHPQVTGGIGIYPANAVHGPFVHVDTRGTVARW
jgi:hypothetical protein